MVMSKEMVFWLVVSYFKTQKITIGWWESGVWRSQRDLPCYPLLPFVHGVGLGKVYPAYSVFSLSFIRQRDPRNVCNAWKKNHPFFSGDIIDVLLWALQQNASECVGSVYETMCYTFVFYAMLMDNDLGRLPYFDSRPGQGPVWCFLLMTLRIIGLEASQWNCNISLACNGSIYIDSKLHLWLSRYGL